MDHETRKADKPRMMWRYDLWFKFSRQWDRRKPRPWWLKMIEVLLFPILTYRAIREDAHIVG